MVELPGTTVGKYDCGVVASTETLPGIGAVMARSYCVSMDQSILYFAGIDGSDFPFICTGVTSRARMDFTPFRTLDREAPGTGSKSIAVPPGVVILGIRLASISDAAEVESPENFSARLVSLPSVLRLPETEAAKAAEEVKIWERSMLGLVGRRDALNKVVRNRRGPDGFRTRKILDATNEVKCSE